MVIIKKVWIKGLPEYIQTNTTQRKTLDKFTILRSQCSVMYSSQEFPNYQIIGKMF